MEPKWLEWARTLQAISQIGLHFTVNVFDRERFAQIRDLAAEMMAAHTGTDTAYIRDLFDQQAGYATPKVDVRGVVFRGDALLMVREKLDEGRWTIPGGWADVQDTPSEAVEREIYEESGYRTLAVKVLAVYDRNKQGHPPYPFRAYKLFFRCELLDDRPEIAPHDHETGEATFFHEHEIPADISTGRVTAAQIARFFEHLRQPDLPTDFD
jgi:ADP-ribose pyrophosphatase YjhB (NUDIX family)